MTSVEVPSLKSKVRGDNTENMPSQSLKADKGTIRSHIGRQKLLPLQLAADNSGLTRPGTPKTKLEMIHKTPGPVQIYQDPASPEACPVSTEVQTDICAISSDSCVCSCHSSGSASQEGDKLQGEKEKCAEAGQGDTENGKGQKSNGEDTQDEEVSAEALDLMSGDIVPEKYWETVAERRREALEESLHENEMLHQLVAELKEENQKLGEMASQADYFASLLQELTGEAEEDETSTKDEQNEDSSEETSQQENEETDS